MFKHSDKVPYGEKFLNTFEGCLICGQTVKNERFWLNVTFDSTIWSMAEGDCPDDLNQGLFVVGSDCAKKFEKGVLYEQVA